MTDLEQLARAQQAIVEVGRQLHAADPALTTGDHPVAASIDRVHLPND
ncbi:MAG TPA: hypothetical protein VFM75_00305 [Modicisalibacter sp.]|nr:hypothetical protein [Modicisalibacter sp.]